MIMGVSGNGVSLVIQVGRQGPPGPLGPAGPVVSFNTYSEGAGAAALVTLPALPIGEVCAQIAEGYVTAQNTATGELAVWQIVVAVVRGIDGTLSFPGNPTDGTQASNPSVTLLIGDADMLACTITPVLNANTLEIDGAGVAGTQINWTGSLTLGGNAT